MQGKADLESTCQLYFSKFSAFITFGVINHFSEQTEHFKKEEDAK